jgi:hypothetical protein
LCGDFFDLIFLTSIPAFAVLAAFAFKSGSEKKQKKQAMKWVEVSPRLETKDIQAVPKRV